MSDAKVGSWSVAESPVTIEYSLVVIEEIRREVALGYQRLSRGGIEVGGVLYGMREGRTLRIMAIRPISCEHARGPAFLLSDKDRMELHEQLVSDAQDPRLEEMISVGWFLSHTRSEITLMDSDLETYSIFFPAPWQVTFVVRPGRGGTMRGGFFVRETDGTVKSERSYLEFNFPDRLAGVLDGPTDRAPRERGTYRRPPQDFSAPEPGDPAGVPVRESISSGTSPEANDTGAPIPSSETPRGAAAHRRKWYWLAPWVIAVLMIGYLGVRSWIPHTSAAPEPISLSILDRQGQLQIEWKHDAGPVVTATGGSLEIIDGGDAQMVPLTPQILAMGTFTYLRRTGDVEVRMTVSDASGTKVQEASRFLGRPAPAPVKPEDLTALQQGRDELEAEVRRLRQENSTQSARIQQLERTLRILQTRLGIDQGKQP
jgi:hypothetical protein